MEVNEERPKLTAACKGRVIYLPSVIKRSGRASFKNARAMHRRAALDFNFYTRKRVVNNARLFSTHVRHQTDQKYFPLKARF